MTAERLCRSKKQMPANVLFDETMPVQVSQKVFLTNENNKVCLIAILTTTKNSNRLPLVCLCLTKIIIPEF